MLAIDNAVEDLRVPLLNDQGRVMLAPARHLDTL